MAVAQLQVNGLAPSMKVSVYYKWQWTQDWQYAPHWQALSAMKSAAPGMGTASFRLLYGSGTWEDNLPMTDGSLLNSFAYCYVQIRGLTAGNEITLWTGLVFAEKFSLLGKHGSISTADQVLDACGLDMLLDRRLDGAWAEQKTGEEIKPVWLDCLPVFNRRHEHGGDILGNRSTGEYEVGEKQEYQGQEENEQTQKYDTYIFADEGSIWSNWDIAEYLLRNYQQDNGPVFALEAAYEIRDALGSIEEVYDFNSVTLRQALNTLFSRARGFAWKSDVTRETKEVEGKPVTEEKAVITVFSLLDEYIQLGDVEMPANYNKVSLDLWTDPETTTVEVTQDMRQTYDKIIVRGALMKSCCTLWLPACWASLVNYYKGDIVTNGGQYFICLAEHISSIGDRTTANAELWKELANYEPVLEQAWTDAEEAAYKNAAADTPGYEQLDEDEQAQLNDKFRSSDRFDRVFTTFRIPRNWDWTIADTGPESGGKKWFVNPRIYSDGSMDLPQQQVDDALYFTNYTHNENEKQAAYRNADKCFLNYLPFKEGFDYSDNDPVDKNPVGSEPEFRRMFAAVKDRDGFWQYAEKVEPFGAAVRPLTRELAVEVRFRPQYMAAKNHFSDDDAPGQHTEEIEEDGTDYTNLFVTGFIETDQYVRESYNLTNYENKRILTIDIPDAELWFICPETIVDISATGCPVCYAGQSLLLRDDRPRLKAAMAAALGWYSKVHSRLEIRVRSIDPGIPIGSMVDNGDVTYIGVACSVVTSVSWDFEGKPAATTIRTDFAELDIAAIFSRG